MKAEIIAIGSELLTPDNIDTNSLYLTQRLNEAGCQVHLKTIVGDDLDDIAGVLRAALQRSDLILFSGGLGPTEDDRTREAVAGVLERPLFVDNEILEVLRQRFFSHGFRMTKNNEKQAEVIVGAEVLDNVFGTAPGMWIEEKGRIIVLLPGPPRQRYATGIQILSYYRHDRIGVGCPNRSDLYAVSQYSNDGSCRSQAYCSPTVPMGQIRRRHYGSGRTGCPDTVDSWQCHFHYQRRNDGRSCRATTQGVRKNAGGGRILYRGDARHANYADTRQLGLF